LLQLTSSLGREQFSQTVLKILETRGKSHEFLLHLSKKDLLDIKEASVLFRTNTVATKAVVEYMKMVGQSYISDTLFPPIRAITQSNTRYDDSSFSSELEVVCNAVLSCILGSANRVPLQLKKLFKAIKQIAVERFGEENVSYLSVTAFFFLRLLCPAIVSPSLYGILNDVIDDDSSRTLRNVAKTIQYLANFKVSTPENDERLNKFLEKNTEKMKRFIDDISVISEDTYVPALSAAIDIERELAGYYHYLVSQSTEILERTNTAQREQLSDILDVLSSRYEEKWPNRSTPYQYRISFAKAVKFLS